MVYDSINDRTWRVSHPAMYPDPDFAQSDVQGYKFVLMDGIVGLAFDEQDLIYFQPLATDRLVYRSHIIQSTSYKYISQSILGQQASASCRTNSTESIVACEACGKEIISRNRARSDEK